MKEFDYSEMVMTAARHGDVRLIKVSNYRNSCHRKFTRVKVLINLLKGYQYEFMTQSDTDRRLQIGQNMRCYPYVVAVDL